MAQRKNTPSQTAPDTFAGGMTDAQLHCRELGHEWRHHTVTWDTKARVFDRSLRCRSCKTLRRQVLDSRGHVIRNAYAYTDGYLAKGVQAGTLSRDVFRLEALTRWFDTHNETPKAG